MDTQNKVVTVLDFSTGEIHIYRCPISVEDVEQFLIGKGHRIEVIDYMCTKELILRVHQSDESSN